MNSFISHTCEEASGVRKGAVLDRQFHPGLAVEFVVNWFLRYCWGKGL